tara:strand:+ start:1899 stop:2252 length:354 start_codon:yes stop_codon:yes gene_type:complete
LDEDLKDRKDLKELFDNSVEKVIPAAKERISAILADRGGSDDTWKFLRISLVNGASVLLISSARPSAHRTRRLKIARYVQPTPGDWATKAATPLSNLNKKNPANIYQRPGFLLEQRS